MKHLVIERLPRNHPPSLRAVKASAARTLLLALLALIPLCACHPAQAQSPNAGSNIFDAALAPYNADKSGATDAAAAINQAVSDAVTWSNANNAAVVVQLDAGTYLLQSNPIRFGGVNNTLTLTGHTSGDTFLTYTRTQNRQVLDMENNPGTVTVENFTEDASDPTQLAFTQGTITAIDRKAGTITVQAESGYPLLNRPDIVADPSDPTKDGISPGLYTYSDPKRPIWDHPVPTMQSIAPSADGTTAVIKVNQISSFTHVGEAWVIMDDSAPDNAGIGSIFVFDNNVTLQNINYYGGIVQRDDGDGGWDTGNISLVNYYQGPPPTAAQATATLPARFLPDRRITCLEGFQAETRGTFSVLNSNLSGGWDDVLDLGGNFTHIISQSAPSTNQIHVESGYDIYKQGDLIELSLASTGAVYSPPSTTITNIANFVNAQGQQDGSLILTLSNNVTVQNAGDAGNGNATPGSDFCCDMTYAGAITLQNSSFSSGNGHVFLHGGGVGTGTTITGCTFHDMSDSGVEVVGGPVYGQGPLDAHNVLIQNSTFERCQSVGIAILEGTVLTGSNVQILNNTFLDTGNEPYEASNGCAIILDDINGATISGNWFDRNWGANICAQYDDNLTITGNTFNHPNFIHPALVPAYTSQQTAPGYADPSSVVFLANDAGVTLSDNIVNGAGPYTKFLDEVDTNVTNASGLTDGVTQVDNPLAFYLSYDKMVMAQPSSGSILDQVAWTGAATQKWIATPSQSVPGYATLTDDSTGQFVGNGSNQSLLTSQGNTVYIDLENQNNAVEQLWDFTAVTGTADNLDNAYSGYAVNVYYDLSTAGTQLCQYTTGNVQNQDFCVVDPPKPVIASGFENETLTWAPVPEATSYAVKRATSPTGTYTTLASGLTATTYADMTAAPGTTYYYVVTAAGLPISNNQSPQAAAVAQDTGTGGGVPVNLAPAFNAIGIEPNSWSYLGGGFDGQGYTYSSSLVPSLISWSGNLFSLGAAAKPDAVADAGQRIVLPTGNFSSLLILGSYLGSGPSATGTFQPTVTYTDGTSAVLSQGMTNWCASASQSGESNALTASYRDFGDGAKQTLTCYVHGYQIPIDPTRQTQWLDLPSTGQFRLLAMTLDNSASVMAPGQLLQQGQYLASPTGKCYLTQQSDGNLVVYAGTPASRGAALWSSGKYPGTNQYYMVMQGDGNLVTYQGTPAAPGGAVWASGTSNSQNGNGYLQLIDSGHVQVLQGNAVVWDDGVDMQTSTLAQGLFLNAGDSLNSPQGKYFLTQQVDGNLVMYQGTPANPGSPVWASGYSISGSAPFYTAMQTDGNLVTYQGTAGVTPQTAQYAVWSSGTGGHPGSYLSVTDTPEVQVVNNGNILWQKP